jgi:hypothetical protein
MTIYITLGALAWIACGIAACGYCFAHYQRKYASLRFRDLEADSAFAFLWLVLGPLSLFVSFLNRHMDSGWLWPWSRKALIEAGRA